jgi:hypothetical protein
MARYSSSSTADYLAEYFADELFSREVATVDKTDVVNQADGDHKPKTHSGKLTRRRTNTFSASGPKAVMTMEERQWVKREKMRAFESLLEAKAEITIKFSLTPALVC